jgi:hypothetical protein
MSDRAIQESILKLSGQHKSDNVVYCNATVNSVDLKARTCNVTVIDGHTEFELPNVMLMAVVDDGILIEPVIDSTVKIIFSQKVEPFVVQFSEIENITIITNSKVVFNSGNLGGMVNVIELVKKLNIIEKDLKKLKQVFNSWIPIANDGGNALKMASSSWRTQQIATTIQSEIENTKIINGN